MINWKEFCNLVLNIGKIKNEKKKFFFLTLYNCLLVAGFNRKE